MQVPGCASVIAEASGAVANLKIKDGDIIQYVCITTIDNFDSLIYIYIWRSFSRQDNGSISLQSKTPAVSLSLVSAPHTLTN